MVPLRLDRARIQRFVDAAGERLIGDWLLVGGAAAAVWFSDSRVTEDVDLIGLAGTAAERLQLTELAMAEGLPIEAVNSAADFFVQRIPDWRNAIEVLRRGSTRPTSRTAVRSSVSRAATRSPIDAVRVAAELDRLPTTPDAALAERRQLLREALS